MKPSLCCPNCGSRIGMARRIAGAVTVWCYLPGCIVRERGLQWSAPTIAKAHDAMVLGCEEAGFVAALVKKIEPLADFLGATA